MPHGEKPLEDATAEPRTNAELASELRDIAGRQVSLYCAERLRLAAERLEQYDRFVLSFVGVGKDILMAVEKRVAALERQNNATSHSTGEGEE